MAQEKERKERQRIEMEKDATEQELKKERFEREREGMEMEQRYKEEMFRQREEHWLDNHANETGELWHTVGTRVRTGVDKGEVDENSGVAYSSGLVISDSAANLVYELLGLVRLDRRLQPKRDGMSTDVNAMV